MSKSQKNICILVCLLILLILLCTLTHMSSIKVSKPTTPANATDAQNVVAPVTQPSIDFTITKVNQTVTLRGNLDQQSSHDRLVNALPTNDLTKEVHLNAQRAPADEVIALTEQLLVPFMATYQQGSIRYHEGQLSVDGTVSSRADKNRIANLLANSTIPSVDNTKVLEPTPVEVPLPDTPVETPEVTDPMEVNETRIPNVPEVNPSLPTVPEVNVTLPEPPTPPAVPEVTASVEVNESSIPSVPEVNLSLPSVPEVEAEVPKPESEEIQAIEAEIQKIIDFENINFELDKAELTPQSRETLQKIADILKENSQVRVEIGGHTDSSGDDQHNLTLSQQRVDRVKQELILLQIEESRLTSVGYGETRPLVPNDTQENRKKNRRVEFNIIGE